MPLAEDSLITMNQILRVVYADQMYTHPIFRFEKWDSSEKELLLEILYLAFLKMNFMIYRLL